MVTIKDIAKQAGVSSATVSYVLNNTQYITPETKKRVLKAVQELHYVPNATARSLRAKRSKTIGLIISDIRNPFYPDLAKGCEDIAYANDYDVLIFNTNEDKERMQKAILKLKQERVDGIIIACAVDSDKAIIEDLVKNNYPVVLAHRKIEGLQVNYIVADQFNAVVEASHYLLSLGHKKIAFVMGIDGSSVNSERLKGYQMVMQENHLDINPGWIIQGNGTYQNSYDIMLDLWKNMPKAEQPTAVLARNDISALGIMDAALDMGMKLPDDLAIIGFDDLFLSESRGIQLTTVRIPRYELGQISTRILIDIIEKGKYLNNPQESILPTKLIIRKTCGVVKE